MEGYPALLQLDVQPGRQVSNLGVTSSRLGHQEVTKDRLMNTSPDYHTLSHILLTPDLLMPSGEGPAEVLGFLTGGTGPQGRWFRSHHRNRPMSTPARPGSGQKCEC